MSLALFPLNTVLFPGCTLDLQIFEARYLDMIGRCMKKGERLWCGVHPGWLRGGHGP